MPSRHSISLEEYEDGIDDHDVPRCEHCKGEVCIYLSCTKDNGCPHGGYGKPLENGRWACASKHCQNTCK